MTDLPEVDPLYEVDDYGEADGNLCTLHIAGHVDTDTAVALAWAYLIEWDGSWDHRIDAPRHVWTSREPFVDDDGEEMDSWVAVYSTTPREGWEPVTRIDLDPHPYRPCPKCAWHSVMGFPVDNFIDPPAAWITDGYLWFCGPHADDISRRLDEARRTAYAELAQQGA